ncbi:MAG TPA: phosphatase PAP2 family protein [Luteimonas sp.]|nr:phosphatase PAP2 family protein [Luteimonas sp.]
MRALGMVISVGLTLAWSQAFAQHEPDVADPREPVPFLADPALRPDTARILPPAPREGSAAYEADRQTFRTTRKLENTPRWEQAKRDVPLDVPDMLKAYSCAAGVQLTPVKTPLLAGLLTRMSADAERAIEPAKAANRRLRPLEIDPGPVCQPREKLAGSYDYPSGHATWGWSVGLVLAELAPERSTELLMRARTYAESRVVCGAHNASAIQAGATNAAALVAALHASSDFRAAMDAARHEMAAVRATGKLAPDAAVCALETQAATF